MGALANLKAFVASAQAGSFSGAARQLGAVSMDQPRTRMEPTGSDKKKRA
jgi:hypothetical protein